MFSKRVSPLTATSVLVKSETHARERPEGGLLCCSKGWGESIANLIMEKPFN